MIKVKVCGITSLRDAKACIRAGADLLGFIFAKSPRQISPAKARSIISKLPERIKKVGVFVNKKPGAVNKLVKYCGLDFVQLHGEETPAYCNKVKAMTIKAIRVKGQGSRGKGRIKDKITKYKNCVAAVLLDTYQKGRAGGTGKTFDWDIARSAKKLKIPLILSGGLSPDNVCEAIKKVRPYAVDLNSGVEDAPGKKNAKMVRKAVEKARRSCIMA